MSLEDPKSLNEVVHGRSRLKVLAVLSNITSIDFPALRNQLNMTDGGLGSAIRKLEDAKLVKQHKAHEAGKSKTTIAMTAKGKREYALYLTQLRAIVGNALVD